MCRAETNPPATPPYSPSLSNEIEIITNQLSKGAASRRIPTGRVPTRTVMDAAVSKTQTYAIHAGLRHVAPA